MQDQVVADGVFRSPLPLLDPASIAIVGASERGKWATQIFRNLREFGYPGKIYPVNPRLSRVWDSPCYPDLASLPEPPQHAMVIVPAPAVQDVIATGVKAGLKSATIYASQIGGGSRCGARRRLLCADRAEWPHRLRAQLHGRQRCANDISAIPIPNCAS